MISEHNSHTEFDSKFWVLGQCTSISLALIVFSPKSGLPELLFFMLSESLAPFQTPGFLLLVIGNLVTIHVVSFSTILGLDGLHREDIDEVCYFPKREPVLSSMSSGLGLR